MDQASTGTGRRPRPVTTTGTISLVALLLTLAVTAWWCVMPPDVLVGGDPHGLRHLSVGALVALPPALLAVAGTAWWAGRRAGGPFSLWAHAGVTAGLFAGLLLLTAPLQGGIRTALQATPDEPNLAAVRYDTSCLPMFSEAECRRAQDALAGADARTVERAHHEMLATTGHSAADHAAMNAPFYAPANDAVAGSGANTVAFAIQDTFFVVLVALPLMLLVLFVARRRRPTGVTGRGTDRSARLRYRMTALVGLAALLVAGDVAWSRPATAAVVPFSTPLNIPPTLTDAAITIQMRQASVQIMPTGPATQMWTYNGLFPGPIIRRPSGQPTRITFQNNLPGAAGQLTVHQHGSHALSTEDGQPNTQLIGQGGQRTYVYDNTESGGPERAATQWYHDHRMDVTGRNVWNGLVGLLIVDDAVDSALPLPRDQFDVPLIITDRTFDANNQIPYNFQLFGTVGDTWLVNGRPQPYFDVADRRYRIRILNAANRRPMTLALSNGAAMTQIGTESGLLPAPVQRTSINLQPAERAEIVVDFNGLLGQNLVLLDTETTGTNGNPPRELIQFRVDRDVATDPSTVPATLRPVPPLPTPTRDREFDLRIRNGRWTINNQSFDPDRIDADPVRGTTERWTFFNVSPSPHAIHLHDVDWRLVRRFRVAGDFNNPTVGTPLPIPPAEAGLKETFLVPQGEGISVATTFNDNVGEYVFHCHMIEHEDLAMMGRFVVRQP
ncbi:multicopper oxidase family protein [Actinoplanes sp. NPDC049548]|uniref:multicopper oxidase family protein n=1 Tax=Actinoplanes sp. NPDC049548 TaxID=3155152 RepID=UPI00343A2449